MRVASVSAVVLTIALTACGTSKYDSDPDYDSGFTDGCATGTARSPGTPASKPVRDQALWDASEAYRVGWKAGYSSCGPKAGEIPGDRDPGRH